MAHTRPRSRLLIAAADDPATDPAPPPADAPVAADGPAGADAPADAATALSSPHGRFHALIIVQGETTNDGRRFDALTPRVTPDSLWPLMADDGNHPEHLESVLIGNFDRMELIGDEWHGWGPYLSDPDENALRLINLVKAGELRGISADVEVIEFEVLFPVPEPGEDVTFDPATGAPEFPDLPTENIDGQEYEVMTFDDPILRVTDGMIMGATVLTFPAFARAFVEDDSGDVALAASGQVGGHDRAILGRDDVMRHAGVTGVMIAADTGLVAAAAPTVAVPGRETAPARFAFPDMPPMEWFDVPETPGPMPLTILDSGQVFGHLAIWGECHVGIAGECVEPPPSTCNYARFHTGETPVSPYGRVSTGRLTFGTGHADTRLAAAPAAAHYDNSGTVAADIVAVDGAYGIWVCGAARSTLTAAQVREVMGCPPSGDWRRFGRDLELVGALCVNVPGFNTRRDVVYASGVEQLIEVPTPAVRVRRDDGLIASLIVSHAAPPLAVDTATGYSADVVRSMMIRLAASVGRTPTTRRAEIRARVHGGK